MYSERYMAHRFAPMISYIWQRPVERSRQHWAQTLRSPSRDHLARALPACPSTQGQTDRPTHPSTMHCGTTPRRCYRHHQAETMRARQLPSLCRRGRRRNATLPLACAREPHPCKTGMDHDLRTQTSAPPPCFPLRELWRHGTLSRPKR